MAATKAKPTKEHIAEAVDTLAKWFPEEAANLASNREAIIRHILEGTEPAPGSELALLQPAAKQVHLAAMSLPKFTPCEEACAVVTVDVIFFVFGLVGLHAPNQGQLSHAILRDLGPDTLRGFARAIHNCSTADGAFNKAKALFTLMDQINNAGGFGAVFKVVKEEMTAWEWIKTGVIAVAQITAWFATDGVAFIAEVALTIMSATQLIEDAVKAGKACSS